MALVNMMENFVTNKVEQLLPEYACCQCDNCKEDIIAIALNDLPPKYVSTAKGELFTRANALLQQNAVDIDIAVAKAIEIVGKRPRHILETPPTSSN